jgi:hypothetical protein
MGSGDGALSPRLLGGFSRGGGLEALSLLLVGLENLFPEDTTGLDVDGLRKVTKGSWRNFKWLRGKTARNYVSLKLALWVVLMAKLGKAWVPERASLAWHKSSLGKTN